MILAVLAVLLLASCGVAQPPERTRFTQVELPPGTVPVRIAAAGDELVVAVSEDGGPGIVRHRDGRNTEVPLTPATGYGAEALWYSLAARPATSGPEILAVGGRRGGAHGNVRWSVWRTTGTGVAEQPQPFSTFGGLGAGDLVDAVLPDTGPLLVGTWQSHSAGTDPSVWTTDGTTWTRRSSTGTPLESTGAALNYPMAAASRGAEVVIAGWQVVKGVPRPVVWTLRDGTATPVPLPGNGRIGTAITVSCEKTCSVAGRVDGRLAVWQGGGDTWRRVPGVPEVPVGDRDRPPPPLGDTLVYSDRGTVRIATLSGGTRDAAGPTGVVTGVARVGDSIYVLAGPGNDSQDNNQTLWRAGTG
ncbi:hypothetical protein ACFPCV_34640 [Actinophytocola glycyrrhizae]|uniref:Uncharacterized protein n=2 Tax=Actinophytocola glycyrrhizae TaxID=2044873 RepID=A0ABV9SD42_9PSEU